MSVVLNTERLTLREFSLGDASFIVVLVNSPGWIQFIGDRGIATVGDAERYLTNGPLQSYASNGFGLWCVCLSPNEQPIGMCGLLQRESLAQIDLGFAFLPTHAGHGYALEAVTGTVQYARERLGAEVLLAITVPENIRSIRLLEKIGFRFERVHRMDAEDLQVYSLRPI